RHVWNRYAWQIQYPVRKRVGSVTQTEPGRYRTAGLVKISPINYDRSCRQVSIGHVIPTIITAAVCRPHPERADVVGAVELIERRTKCLGNFVRIYDSVGLIVSPETSRRISHISKVDQVCVNSRLLPLVEGGEDRKITRPRSVSGNG